MAIDDYQGVMVATGHFRAVDGHPLQIEIIARDHDASHAVFTASSFPPSRPVPLGPDGLLYYVGPEDIAYRSLGKAKRAAARKYNGPIVWRTVPNAHVGRPSMSWVGSMMELVFGKGPGTAGTSTVRLSLPN